MFFDTTRTFIPISCNSLPMNLRFIGTEMTDSRRNARFFALVCRLQSGDDVLWFAGRISLMASLVTGWAVASMSSNESSMHTTATKPE